MVLKSKLQAHSVLTSKYIYKSKQRALPDKGSTGVLPAREQLCETSSILQTNQVKGKVIAASFIQVINRKDTGRDVQKPNSWTYNFIEVSGHNLHRKKARMSLIKLSLGVNNEVIYKLFPPRESLVNDIPAGDGNIEKLFFTVLRVLRLEVSMYNVYITNQFQTTFAQGGGGGE